MGFISVPAFFVLVLGIVALARGHLSWARIANRKTAGIVTAVAGVVWIVAVAIDPGTTSPPPVAAPTPVTTTATTAATTTVTPTPTPTTTTVVVAPPPVVTSTMQPTTTTTPPAPATTLAATTTTAVAPQAANAVVSAATLDRLHGHCINFTDRQIIAAAQYSSGDLAKHGQDESPESVASHVADATQGAQVDCQGTFAAYLVLREGPN